MILSREKLKIPLSLFMESDIFALIRVSEIFEYQNNQKTNNVIGTGYYVVNPDSFEKFLVKVIGKKPIISQEEIEQCDSRIWVSFENAIVKPYEFEYRNVKCSVVADSAKIAE